MIMYSWLWWWFRLCTCDCCGNYDGDDDGDDDFENDCVFKVMIMKAIMYSGHDGDDYDYGHAYDDDYAL